jgi:two-component system, NarL family, nitrate/nitrite response regulator NarL
VTSQLSPQMGDTETRSDANQPMVRVQTVSQLKISAGSAKRFGIIDPHPVVRVGIIAILQSLADGDVIINDYESVDHFDAEYDVALNFDAIICDHASLLPRLSKNLRSLVDAVSPAPVLVVSDLDDDIYAVRSTYAFGAAAYVNKSRMLQQLAPALALALSGEKFVPAQTVLLNNESANHRSRHRPAFPPADTRARLLDEDANAQTHPGIRALTPRLFEIARLMAQGMPNRAIAERLGISDSTVKAQAGQIFKKLGVNNRTEAALLMQGVVSQISH